MKKSPERHHFLPRSLHKSSLIWGCTRQLLLLSASIAAISTSVCHANAAIEVVEDSRLPLKAFVVNDGKPGFALAPAAFGVGWKWMSLGAKDSKINLQKRVVKKGDSVSIEYSLSSAEEMELGQVIIGIPVRADGAIEKITAHLADQTTKDIPVPPTRNAVAPTSSLEFSLRGGGQTRIDFDPPCTLANENGALRIQLIKERIDTKPTVTTFTIHANGGVKLANTLETIAPYTFTPGKDWVAFSPSGKVEGNVTGLDQWLDKPAGKRGRVLMQGDRFVFPDGTPVQWWGTNLQFSGNAPARDQAELTAKRFAAWGVNCVRLHKFTDPGWAGIGDPQDATLMTAEGWDRFDYFAHQLQQAGVYYGWSHTFKFTVRPGNRDRLLAYDEIVNNLKGNTYALINVAEDVQDLMIERVVNLLKHKNPHTGLTYAQDPALSWVELQNEDDIFFYSLSGVLPKAPTYLAKYEENFAAWLRTKYSTREALGRAWEQALKPEDDLEKRVKVEINAAYMLSQESLPKKTGGYRQRALDQAAFMEATQMKFYNRFAKAIRDAGYDGPLIGSPWQAPSMLPHLLNLHNDARVGIIDRHNYWGGWGMVNASVLDSPGGGNFSSGLQQVSGRPFMLSEWNTQWPSLYSADGPVIIATYGMGLQSWSGSFQFNSDSKTAWNSVAGKIPWDRFPVDVPNQIGQYPVLARMVLRGDVKPGPVISVRRVSDQALTTNTFDFEEKIVQNGDEKSLTGTVPQTALTVGRVLLEFSGTNGKPSTSPNLSGQGKENVWNSATGQLRWDGKQRLITINTAGTQGVVGFGADKDWKLDGVNILPRSPYASILLTAYGPKETIANARTALMSAVARNANTGMELLLLGNALDDTVLNEGTTPILMEPVRATVRLARKPSKIEILNHDGRRSGRTLKVNADSSFDIDTGRDNGWLYEISF